MQPILVRRRGRALPDHRGRAALAGRPAGRASPPCRSPCATCRTSGCWSWPSSRTSSAQELTPARGGPGLPAPAGGARPHPGGDRAQGGQDRSTVANTLRLLRLPREVRELLGAGTLDAGHARALLALERAEDQLALGREAARAGPLGARGGAAGGAAARARRRARRPRATPTRGRRGAAAPALGTRVEIARRGKGGAIRMRSRARPSCSGSSSCSCAARAAGSRR